MNDNTDIDLLESLHSSTAVWAKTLFPDIFNRPFSEGHLKACAALDNPYLKKVLLICHRGFGKSSLLQTAFGSKEICFKNAKCIAPCSATATLAEEKSETLKRELIANPWIQKLFGPMKSDRWSREEWWSNNGVRVLPRGVGQQIRGPLPRPDRLGFDDIETTEGTASEDQRAKLKEWLFGDAFGSVDLATDYRYIFVGTPLHEDSLLLNLASDPTWHVVMCPLFDDDMNTLWPEYMSSDAIKKMADEYRSQGKIDTFYREYGLKIISAEDASFQSRYFKYYDEALSQLNKRDDIEHIIIVDPAKSVTPQADDSAIVGLAFSPVTNQIFVRDVIAGKMYPNEVYDHIFSMAKRLNVRTIGIEVTSLNEWIVWPMKNEIIRRGFAGELVELKAKAKKEERIAALIPLYRQGLIYHNKNVTHKLEQQLLSFPRSAKWDVMDALAYVVSMLDKGERFMGIKQDKPESLAPIVFDSKIEDEYKELDYDESMETEEWMLV